MSKRETIEMDEEVLYYLLDESCLDSVEDEDYKKDLLELMSDYELVENEIYNNDEYDGGAYYEATIRVVASDRFYRIHYTDWDMSRNDGWCAAYHDGISLDTTLSEVFPKQITKTIYE